MSVQADRTGGTATITVTIDVSDIVADTSLTLAQKRQKGVARAISELARASRALLQSDASLDADAASYGAEVTATKLARPTGSF